jgi:hypothetical protein
MADAKFTPWTPGPWRVSSERRRVQPAVFGADGSPVASCGGNAPGYGQYSAETHQRRESNARLIAVAPELYAALDALVADTEKSDRRNSKAVGKARAALAKARGDQ